MVRAMSTELSRGGRAMLCGGQGATCVVFRVEDGLEYEVGDAVRGPLVAHHVPPPATVELGPVRVDEAAVGAWPRTRIQHSTAHKLPWPRAHRTQHNGASPGGVLR